MCVDVMARRSAVHSPQRPDRCHTCLVTIYQSQIIETASARIWGPDDTLIETDQGQKPIPIWTTLVESHRAEGITLGGGWRSWYEIPTIDVSIVAF